MFLPGPTWVPLMRTAISPWGTSITPVDMQQSRHSRTVSLFPVLEVVRFSSRVPPQCLQLSIPTSHSQ